MIRYLIPVAALMAAPAAGCSQSLFDADPGHEDGSPPVPPDGAGNEPDSGPDSGPDDDPDGGPGPMPGIDDAVANFSLQQQGGKNGRWSYMEIQVGADVTPPVFRPMTRGIRASMFEGWLGAGTGSSVPAIVPCASYQSTPMPYEPCAGAGDRLLLETTLLNATAPVLQWTAPATGIYRMHVDALIPDGFPVTSQPFLAIARNGQFEKEVSMMVPEVFDVDVELVEQDSVLLIATSAGTTPVPVAANVTLFEQQGTETCEIAVRFDGEEGGFFQNRCGDRGSFIENGVPTQPGDAQLPPGIAGSARQFVDGSFLQYDGAPIDHSREWTVQFWARLDGSSTSDQWLLSDLDCNAKGGVAVSLDAQGELVFEMAVADGTDYCTTRSPYAVSLSAPLDGTWHFYRVSWNKALLTVCRDGGFARAIQARDQAIGPARPMELGRSGDRPGSFAGQLADVRVYSRAIFCQ